MKAIARKALWARLQAADLVSGELAAGTASPWFVRVMLGIAGWIGALFILGFIGAGFAMLIRGAGGMAFLGLVCCGVAFAVFQLAKRNDFAGQFGLATGLAGQALCGAAIFQQFTARDSAGFFLLFCFEALLTAIMPNFVHRIFTTLAAVAALSLGLAQAGLLGLALPLTAAGCALVWRNELRLAARAELWQPVGYGLVLGVLQTATTFLLGGDLLTFFQRSSGGWLQQHAAAVGTTLTIVVVLAVTVSILQELAIGSDTPDGLAILGCAALALMVTFPAHGLAAALLLLLLGFAGGNRILCGLGLLAAASFLSHYYYQLRETLLYKSMILGMMGTILLLGRWAVQSLLPAREVRRDA